MADAVHGLPLLLREDMHVTLVPPELKGPRGHVVTSESAGGSAQLVSLSGVYDIYAASRLVGRWVLARQDELPGDFELHDPRSLVGREVEDAELGSLGSVCDLLVGPANDVWVVRGPYGEVLIPAVEPIVRSWNDEGPILVRVPEGILGLGG